MLRPPGLGRLRGRGFAAWLGLAPLLASSPAPVLGAAHPGIARPLRLTAGAANQLLGVASPDEQTLYFVDDDRATYQVRAKPFSGGAPRLLFDDSADATWPRPSPDGQRLLYVSHQTAAAGQLCVRELAPGGGHEPGPRRCLSGENEVVFEAEWLPDGRGIVALVRNGLGGDLELVRYSLDGGASVPVLAGDAGKNRKSPALSPDGRWLAAVPTERKAVDVGTNFASDNAGVIELHRLDAPGTAPLRLHFDLPGSGGFPAFSVDGRYLYFTQFLNDSRLDGVIDGNDNGVLFRVPFRSEAKASGAEVVDVAHVEQLTSGAWNCQYARPTRERLLVSCAFEGAVHVYSLPLEGAVPTSWSRDKLEEELHGARDRWEELLLLERRLPLEERTARTRTLQGIILRHLALGEYESAGYYARALEADGDDEARALAPVIEELVGHRRAERALGRGELSGQFIAEARAREGRLDAAHAIPGSQAGHPEAAALSLLVESEIADTIGEQKRAIELLSRVDISASHDPFVLRLYAERTGELYRLLGERGAQLASLTSLATHASLSTSERLQYADTFISALVSGRSHAEVPALLADAEKRAPAASDLAFRIALEERLAPLRASQKPTAAVEESIRGAVFDLYRKNPDFDRRRALVNATIRRAAVAGSGYLLYEFANTWVSSVPDEKADRRVAEALYRQVLLERAYLEVAAGQVSEARGHFFGVTLQTDSLEAHVGYVEERLREGKSESDLRAEYQRRYKATPGDPVHAFVRAYLAGRRIPRTADPVARQAARREAEHDLAEAATKYAGRAELQQLSGYLAYHRFLDGHDRPAALDAVEHFLLALDLAEDAPRLRAAAAESLASVEAAVGNHELARQWYGERERLPFRETDDPAPELAHRLGKARAEFHLDHDEAALAAAKAAMALTARSPTLETSRPLVLERAALYALSSGQSAEAAHLYDALVPLADAVSLTTGGEQVPGIARARARTTSRLGRAAALIGAGRPDAAIADLDEVDRSLGLALPYLSTEARATDALIASGLRAQAEAARGRYAAAGAAMQVRRDLLAKRAKGAGAAAVGLDLALADARLAEFAYRRRAFDESLVHVEAGLAEFERWSRASGTVIHPLGLSLLEAYAALHVDAGLPLSRFRLDLPARLDATLAALRDLRAPSSTVARERLVAFRTALSLERQTKRTLPAQ